MEDNVVKLLEDIKRLLVPISVAAEPQYQAIMKQRNETAIASILEIVGRSAVQVSAARAMDGTRTPTEVRTKVSFDSGNFSKFCKRLRDAGLLVEQDGKLSLVVDPSAIQWPEVTK